MLFRSAAAGFLAGPEGNRRMVRELEASTGAKVVSTAEAMVEALRFSGVKRTVVVTPYLAAINDGLSAYLEHSGIEVETLSSFHCKTTAELGAITSAQVENLALATVKPESKALFIACSQLPTLPIIAGLRKRLGIPVWSSIQATAWSGARVMSAAGQPLALPTAAAPAHAA